MISESKFHMWRCVFAMAHADGFVSEDEKTFMRDVLADLAFSDEQRAVLMSDIEIAQNPLEMYQMVSAEADRSAFFKFAKTMVWVDGEYGMDEQGMMTQLQRVQVIQTDVDALVGNVDFEIEGGGSVAVPKARRHSPVQVKDMIFSFKDAFNKSLGEE